ncbi:MAG: hypothetical protein GXO19_03420 [Epsilonproteobacteria bacterium]|nr:hypothetical protein [Campylobacterota bacterium]NPA56768.1 hypothetical protein [Campylobacterota bacterium]
MIYLYVRTDNRRDLDRLRRTVALAREFDEVYLMTTDFRAALYGRELGIQRTVGIEDFRNISQICQRGDILIFDSDEHLENDHIHQEMIDYFGRFIRISYDPADRRREGEILISPYLEGEGIVNGILIDRRFFQGFEKGMEPLFFWGDADYEKELLEIAPRLGGSFSLIEGLYFFAGYDDELREFFREVYPPEEYLDLLRGAGLLLTASPQTALEGGAAGARVAYLPKGESEYEKLLGELGLVRWREGLPLQEFRELDREALYHRGTLAIREALEAFL